MTKARLVIAVLGTAILTGPAIAVEIPQDLDVVQVGDRIFAVKRLSSDAIPAQIERLNAEAAKFSVRYRGTFDGCEEFIDISSDRQDSNHLYGAFCAMHRATATERVAVCLNPAGSMSLHSIAPADATRRRLIAFVFDQCFR